MEPNVNLTSNIYPTLSLDSQTIFVGEVGKIFRVFANTNLTGATSVVMKVKKPTGAEVSWSGTVDASNPYYALYTTVSNDLDIEGPYLLSLQVTLSGAQLIGNTVPFNVYEQFEDGFVPPPH